MLLMLWWLGCAAQEGSAPPAQSPPGTPSRDLDAVLCASDSDCPQLACGPCNSGDAVMQRHVLVECYRNPCPEAAAVCRNAACAVK